MRALLILVTFLLTINCIAQTSETSKIGLYKWREVVFIQPCYINGDNYTTTTTNAAGIAVTVTVPETTTKAGQKFRVLKIIDGANAIIQVLDYTKETTGPKKYQATPDFYKYNFRGTIVEYNSLTEEAINSRNYGIHQAYFRVGVSILDELAVKESTVGGSLAAGVINFPFKYRIQKGNADFSGAFNFGAGIGYTFPHLSWRSFSHSIISGYSISNIVLDSSNSNKNQDKLASTNNFAAFSFSLGYLVQYQKVQAGIFLGWDRLSKINQNEFDWQYQGKPWISIGFGLAIFSGQKEKSDNNHNPTQDE